MLRGSCFFGLILVLGNFFEKFLIDGIFFLELYLKLPDLSFWVLNDQLEIIIVLSFPTNLSV